MDGTIRQGFTLLPDSNHTCSHDVTLHITKQTSHFEGFPTRAYVLCTSVTFAVRSANRTHCAGHVEFHTPARLENPSSPNPLPSLPSVRRGYGNIYRGRFRTGFHSRKRARGGLVRCTARTSRSPPCKPGAVPNTATAATRPLSICHRGRLHSIHAHLRVTTLTHHSITLTPGDAAVCARIPTVISLTYSDLTHAVSLTLGRSLTRAVSITHTIPLTHTRGHSHAVFYSHMSFLPCTGSLPHTACWEARTPAHSQLHHSHTGSLPHTVRVSTLLLFTLKLIL